MLKNKIYNYLSIEIIKNFITILLTFTAIAWVVRAVNFLDLMVEDGYSSSIYFKYSLLNITTIITRFVPLAFLLSLTISIIKFERQQELLILWTSGLTKIKIANIFLSIAFFVTLFQLVLSLYINPFLLYKSRSLLSDTQSLQINTILKSNDFSDSLEGITFYIDKKNINNELINIFIKDVGGNLNTIIDNEIGEKKNSTIIAKKGFVSEDKLVLFDGIIQTLDKKNELKNIQFEKTELSLNKVSTRTIKQPKIQETSSHLLLKCIFDENDSVNLKNCSKKNFKSEVVQTLSRRVGAPLYIPLITVIVSFLLIYKKEKKYNFLKKYILCIISFFALILAEILLKYTGFSLSLAISYFVLPIITCVIFYIYLVKKIITEKVTR
jgi:lipopolysaccharide export system permease protein